MANIAFITLPEKGHINSGLKIARSLTARGHQVWYLQLSEFEEYIRSQGVEFIPMFERFLPENYNIHHHRTPADNVLRRLEPEAASLGVTLLTLLIREFKNTLDKVAPDLVLIDIYTHAVLRKERLDLNVPCLLLNPTITEIGYGSATKIPMLILCPEEFDLPHPERSDHVHYVEPSIDLNRNYPEFQWNEVSNDKQLIYCSLGTQSHWALGFASQLNQRIRKKFLQTVINAMQDNPERQLILSIGSHLRPEEFDAVPPNVLLVNSAPQIDLLKRVCLMITHGGLNSIKECIILGVPMIVFPLAGDQFKNAKAVMHHQLGTRGKIETATEGSIRSMIDQVADNPLIRSKMDLMRDIFIKAERQERALAIIESALADGKSQNSSAHQSGYPDAL